MKKYAKVPQDEIRYVEQLQFEYNAEMNILTYLVKQEGVKEEYLDRYFARAKNKNMLLEVAKKEISTKYLPQGITEGYSYVIDFDSCNITYES